MPERGQNVSALARDARSTITQPIENLTADLPADGCCEVKIKGISQTGQNAENEADVNRIFNRLVADAGGAHNIKVGGRNLGGAKGQFLQKAEGGPEFLVNRGRAPTSYTVNGH